MGIKMVGKWELGQDFSSSLLILDSIVFLPAGAPEKDLGRNRCSPTTFWSTSDPTCDDLIHNQVRVKNDNVIIQGKLKGKFCSKHWRDRPMPFGWEVVYFKKPEVMQEWCITNPGKSREICKAGVVHLSELQRISRYSFLFFSFFKHTIFLLKNFIFYIYNPGRYSSREQTKHWCI